jgi:bifunctional DNA-binding transcriptional regulator/antitoxin component of YhaV-PrlF toxin-antitoxin module
MRASTAKHEPGPRTSARARLRPKAQLTFPEEIRQILHVNEGDEVEFTVEGDGRVTVGRRSRRFPASKRAGHP